MRNNLIDILSYFFFQAEDGIRDRNVTGVQTCALPISVFAIPGIGRAFVVAIESRDYPMILGTTILFSLVVRSEERRVGKECRCGWSMDYIEENDAGGHEVAGRDIVAGIDRGDEQC